MSANAPDRRAGGRIVFVRATDAGARMPITGAFITPCCLAWRLWARASTTRIASALQCRGRIRGPGSGVEAGGLRRCRGGVSAPH